jgi:hypothetical protein
MKNDKTKKTKYAFNINEIKIKKKFQGSLKDFQKLNRGLYDEIESNDMSIKQNKAKLKKLKNLAVKEFVYTNKEIPEHWKTKLDYEQNLLKMFVKDKDFLFYLGHGGVGDNLRTLKETEKNNSSGLNIINKSPKEKKTFPKVIKNMPTISPMKTSSNNHIVRNTRFKENNNMSDKEILGILDEFKNAYPLFEKEKNQEIHSTRDSDKDNDTKSKTFYDSRNFKTGRNIKNINNTIQNNNYMTHRKNVSIDTNKLSSFPTIKQKHHKRQNTFRQNIFTNLLPSSSDKIGKNISGFNSCTDFYKKKPDNKNNIYLNSDNEFFTKKMKINDPFLIKYLESINYFGPYFSYCPPCGNRNLEFYKNLEPNQCLQIIQQIKKNKGKNIILNKNKKKENKVESLGNINRNYQDINDKSIKYNSRSINNNYNESDNNSMIQQVSQGSNDREKLDMFD